MRTSSFIRQSAARLPNTPRVAVTRRFTCVKAAVQERNSTDRRQTLAALVLGLGMLIPQTVLAKDAKEAQKEREARRAALKAAAQNTKQTGSDREAFDVPEYTVSEEARTPNVHSRQNEGARTQSNF